MRRGKGGLAAFVAVQASALCQNSRTKNAAQLQQHCRRIAAARTILTHRRSSTSISSSKEPDHHACDDDSSLLPSSSIQEASAAPSPLPETTMTTTTTPESSIGADKQQWQTTDRETTQTTTGAKHDVISDVTVSVVLLNFVAILWGSQHAVLKSVVDETTMKSSNPAIFTLLRFGLAALLASPYTPSAAGLSSILLFHNTTKNDQQQDSMMTASKTWRWGLEMGLWMFLGFCFQSIGLEHTTAQKSGFLLYLNVKLVPFLAFLLYRRQISAATWGSALTALTGTALLLLATTTNENAGSTSSSSSIAWMMNLNVGDLWSMAAAAASAMFILRLERASADITNAAALNAACLWVVTALSLCWSLAQMGTVAASSTSTTTSSSNLWWSELCGVVTNHPLQLLYLSIVTTAFANWIQTKAQRDITAERAAVIYAMDPVYGAGFSYLLLGETLNGITAWIGAGLITIAAATNAFLDVSRTMEEEEESHCRLDTSDDDLTSIDR